MRNFLTAVVLLGLGVGLNSCFDDPNCINLKNNLVGVSFKKLWDGKADTVGVFGVGISGSDSIFSQSTLATGVAIPLNPLASQQILNFSTVLGDRFIDVRYLSRTQFESVDCGPREILSNLSVFQHNFDSLRVVNNAPQETVGGSNIDVYRCPITNIVKIQFRQLWADTVANGQPLEERLNGVVPTYVPLRFFADAEEDAVVLPLDQSSNSTTFIFDSKDNGINQLTVGYTQQQKELIEKCGVQNIMDGLKINSSDFDISKVLVDSIYDPPTTNIMLLRCPDTNLVEISLKGSDSSNAPNVEFQINEITADYTSQKFYVDSLTSSLILPLDVTKDQTDFNIVFESGAKGISIGYQRTSQVFHGQCNQTLIDDLSIVASDFTTAPLVIADSLQFPTVENIEVINN